MTERVQVIREDGVADVRLARPEKMNALDRPMFEGLIATARELAADRSLRAVVLSGEGRAFSAGLDFASFMAEGPDAGPSLLSRAEGETANLAQSAAWVWTEVPVPVIAAVHGACFGGGLQIALGADLRYVTPDAQLSVMEIRWGLIPDMTGTQTLRHLVPLDVAKELTFTGRRVDGEEALRLGLATRCSENAHAAAMETARQIAANSPTAIRAAKKLFGRAFTADPIEGLRLEEGIQKTLLGSPNQIEAVTANMQKRAPKFEDPS